APVGLRQLGEGSACRRRRSQLEVDQRVAIRVAPAAYQRDLAWQTEAAHPGRAPGEVARQEIVGTLVQLSKRLERSVQLASHLVFLRQRQRALIVDQDRALPVANLGTACQQVAPLPR